METIKITPRNPRLHESPRYVQPVCLVFCPHIRVSRKEDYGAPTQNRTEIGRLQIYYFTVKLSVHGCPGRDRTDDILINSQALLPAELQGKIIFFPILHLK